MNKTDKTSFDKQIAEVAVCNERMIKVQGPANSGKTAALIARCTCLVKEGIKPESILFVSSTPLNAGSVRHRLRSAFAKAGLDGANDITVSCALDICAQVLDVPSAREATGRVPRVLNDAEYKFFLEDVRTLGQPRRRMRGMLNYFYRGWANLESEKEWLLRGEGEEVWKHAETTLKLREAMLAQETPYLCANFLKSDAGIDSREAYDYVCADDFQNLSRSEQTSLCLLAKKQIIVSGNAAETSSKRDGYPYAQGFSKFDTLRHGVAVFNLTCVHGEESIVSFANAIAKKITLDTAESAEEATPQAELAQEYYCDNEASDNDTIDSAATAFPKGAQVVKWLLPEDEIDGLTKYLRTLADADTSVDGSKTCIVVPNKQWARMLERVLRGRGFLISASGTSIQLGGDPRDSNKAKALVAYTLLNLIADPSDMTAWRSWCGFDNFLTNSDAWKELEIYALENKISLAEALDEVEKARAAGNNEPFLRAFTLGERWTSGHELIEKHHLRRGFALLRAIGAEGLKEFEEVNAALAGDETAEQIFSITRRCINQPAFPESERVLHIATYENVCGLKYDNVFVFGCVDGFIPHRDAFEVVSTDDDRDAIMEAEKRTFYCLCGTASKRLIISYFSKAPLELAERSKMQVSRIRSESGERMALTRPSTFLAQTEGERPSTIGGQTLLSEIGLD